MIIKVSIVDYPECFDQIRNIRDDVFSGEQGVPRDLEYDGLDSAAVHAIVFNEDIEIGTGRMLSDGHIGRVAVKKPYRGRGIGKLIMQSLIDKAIHMQLVEVWVSSQYYAKGFYKKFGFVEIGDIYKEAEIDHIKMKKVLSEVKTCST